MVVGAPGDNLFLDGGDEDLSSIENAWSVHVFKLQNESSVHSEWQEITKITATDGQSGDYFGRSVDIYGNFIIVSSRCMLNFDAFSYSRESNKGCLFYDVIMVGIDR